MGPALRRIVAPLARGARGLLVLLAFGALLQALANGALALSAGLLGQALLARHPVGAAEGGGLGSWALEPWLLCWVGLGAAIVKTIGATFSTYAQRRSVFLASAAIRRDVTDSILTSGATGPAQPTEAAIAVRTREVERGLDEGLFGGGRAALELAPLAAALAWLSPTLAAIALGVLAPFFVGLSWLRRRVRADHGRATALSEELHQEVDELVRFADLWRTFGARERVRAQLARASDRAGDAVARADAARAGASGLNEALAAGALLVGLALWPSSSEAPPGGLVAFAFVFFAMYRPLRALGDARSALDRGLDALVGLDALTREREPDAPTPAHSPFAAERLEVQGLALGVGLPVVSLVAEPGEIVAITGATGVGKTTLLRTLLGLTPARGGHVRYGAVDLTERGVGPGERPFAWVPQDPPLVRGTLEENIALGAPGGGDRDTACRALAAFGAEGLIDRRGGATLRDGELSGGERHWVALGRAIASELPVLLLDEPTAGLDPAARRKVLGALRALRGARTILIVTHEHEPVAIADRVIELRREGGPRPARAERSATLSA